MHSPPSVVMFLATATSFLISASQATAEYPGTFLHSCSCRRVMALFELFGVERHPSGRLGSPCFRLESNVPYQKLAVDTAFQLHGRRGGIFLVVLHSFDQKYEPWPSQQPPPVSLLGCSFTVTALAPPDKERMIGASTDQVDKETKAEWKHIVDSMEQLEQRAQLLASSTEDAKSGCDSPRSASWTVWKQVLGLRWLAQNKWKPLRSTGKLLDSEFAKKLGWPSQPAGGPGQQSGRSWDVPYASHLGCTVINAVDGAVTATAAEIAGAGTAAAASAGRLRIDEASKATLVRYLLEPLAQHADMPRRVIIDVSVSPSDHHGASRPHTQHLYLVGLQAHDSACHAQYCFLALTHCSAALLAVPEDSNGVATLAGVGTIGGCEFSGTSMVQAIDSMIDLTDGLSPVLKPKRDQIQSIELIDKAERACRAQDGSEFGARLTPLYLISKGVPFYGFVDGYIAKKAPAAEWDIAGIAEAVGVDFAYGAEPGDIAFDFSTVALAQTADMAVSPWRETVRAVQELLLPSFDPAAPGSLRGIVIALLRNSWMRKICSALQHVLESEPTRAGLLARFYQKAVSEMVGIAYHRRRGGSGPASNEGPHDLVAKRFHSDDPEQTSMLPMEVDGDENHTGKKPAAEYGVREEGALGKRKPVLQHEQGEGKPLSVLQHQQDEGKPMSILRETQQQHYLRHHQHK